MMGKIIWENIIQKKLEKIIGQKIKSCASQVIHGARCRFLGATFDLRTLGPPDVNCSGCQITRPRKIHTTWLFRPVRVTLMGLGRKPPSCNVNRQFVGNARVRPCVIQFTHAASRPRDFSSKPSLRESSNHDRTPPPFAGNPPGGRFQLGSGWRAESQV